MTYLVVRLCTGRERKIDVTEAILHGLAYTLLAHALWAICMMPGSVFPTPDIVGLPLCALFIGMTLSFAINQQVVFAFLRKAGLTREPDFTSIWENTFRCSEDKVGEYVVVELDDDRRILGAVLGVSPHQTDGHLSLQRCQWLPTEPGGDTIPIDGWFLVPAARVKSVHFLPRGDHANG